MIAIVIFVLFLIFGIFSFGYFMGVYHYARTNKKTKKVILEKLGIRKDPL